MIQTTGMRERVEREGRRFTRPELLRFTKLNREAISIEEQLALIRRRASRRV